jgi:hypothetical protein
MARVEVIHTTGIVEVKGLVRRWALKYRLQIPLSHITGVTIDSAIVRRGWKDARIPGTDAPGLIQVGTYYMQGDWVFWDVRSADRALVISLRDERYAMLVLEVADPERTAEAIASARRVA